MDKWNQSVVPNKEELLLGAVLQMLYFIVLLQLQALTIATSVDALECFFIILVSMLQEQQLKAEEARAKLVNFCGGRRDASQRDAIVDRCWILLRIKQCGAFGKLPFNEDLLFGSSSLQYRCRYDRSLRNSNNGKKGHRFGPDQGH